MLRKINTSFIMEKVREFGAGVRKECDKAANSKAAESAASIIAAICKFTVNNTVELFPNIVQILHLEKTEKKVAECFTRSMSYLGDGVSNIATKASDLAARYTKKTT